MKKITYVCILSLLFTLLLVGCGKKDKYPNPNNDTEQYLSGKHYVRMFLADYGPLYLVLDADAAPATVTNFVRLANEGFYDNLTIHRVVEGFMIQGGDPKANGTGGSAYTLPGEFAANGFENPISHVRGTISMARRSDDNNSASSQFFIMQEDAPDLDGQYAAFGTVVSGMEYVDIICANIPIINEEGFVTYDEQPVISTVRVLSEEDFKYLEQYDFAPPTEEDTENDDTVPFSITMDFTGAGHGKTTVANWTVGGEEVYLISANEDLNKISLYEIDLVTMEYDKEHPVASYEDLKAGELIETQIMVPEGLPSHILLVEKTSGTLIKYLITYDGRDGGVMLAPLDNPEN